MVLRKGILVTLLVVCESRHSLAFCPSISLSTPSTRRTASSSKSLTSLLLAKKNKTRKAQESKGFGKVQEATSAVPTKSSTVSSSSTATTTTTATPASTSMESSSSPNPFLQSVPGGSDSVPVMEVPKESTTSNQQLPPEERTKQILREKYGLRSLEEQQFDAKQLELRKEQAKKVQEWKKKVTTGGGDGGDVDIIAMIPGPVLIGLDRFLKAGIAIVGTSFIASGLGITVEAWSKASGQALPDNVENFIVTVIEPNFTTQLLVLLSFSISLGVLAAAQLGSAGAQNREKD
jgi:hypothetical protein